MLVERMKILNTDKSLNLLQAILGFVLRTLQRRKEILDWCVRLSECQKFVREYLLNKGKCTNLTLESLRGG